MSVIINIYKTVARVDAYSKSGEMDDPIWPRSSFTWDGDAGQFRDIQVYVRNDGTSPAYGVVAEVVDVSGPDESTWSKLAATQAALDGATPGNSLALGDIVSGGTVSFWMRVAVPSETDPDDKTDLRLRTTASWSSSSSSSSTSSSSSSNSSSSQSSISSHSSESSTSSSSSSSSHSLSSSSSSTEPHNNFIKGEPLTWIFKMVDATDLWTPETGLTPSAFISKSGGAFVPLTGAPAVSEIGFGWYKVTASTTDTDYYYLIFLATAAGCAQADQAFYLFDA